MRINKRSINISELHEHQEKFDLIINQRATNKIAIMEQDLKFERNYMEKVDMIVFLFVFIIS